MMARWPPRGGGGIWKRKGLRGAVGFSISSIRSICLSLPMACDALEATDRFRSVASKASQAMSKLKQIERMELIEKPTAPRKPFRFQIPPPPRGGQRAIMREGIHMAYGTHQVYSGLDLLVERGERT